ncbi:Tetratricopeptide repeat,FKBP-type peptidyl-prolyl cis-trans isomerase domain,Tetratricopeptide repeat- [Cinara cedri]|uniref:peptidylprolyl isomerase n=1 Tax=Cinara cedri TaxID=506608 RepID=A0A5E4N6L2_9HEMI|nr:Tetratricopeptide repeat,FKBP-type peptidyl-prolyl cis-trans isomerase domain,Tetratricopeptide repeat- [Cinara cedri]
MEISSKLKMTIPEKETTDISDFINGEQGNFSEPPATALNIDLVDSEQNSNNEISQFVHEDDPPQFIKEDQHSLPVIEDKPEQSYQDILGSGDLMKKIIKPGTLDERPTKGEQIVINLVGRLQENNDIIEEEENLEITLGDCEVIQGVHLALSLMNEGEIAELQIASRFGYGEKGLIPKVPSGAKLVYTVELVAIKPEIVPDELTSTERLKIGQKKKDKGNWWYARNEYSMALHLYRKALQYFGGPGEKIVSDTDESNILRERIKTLNNMAAVHISMNNLGLALETLENVLNVEPNNEKGIMRKGKVLALKGQNAAAARELQKALKINPNDKTVQNLLSSVEAALVKERAQERELYKKMLGQNDASGKPAKDTNKLNSLIIISGLVAGLAVVGGYCYLNNNFPFNKFSAL